MVAGDDGLGGCSGETEGVISAAGAVMRDVGDGGRRAVVGETHAVAREMQQSAKFRWRIGWQVGGSDLRS